MVIFLGGDILAYRVSQLNWIRTAKCFTRSVVSQCVLDLTTSPVLISVSVSHCVFWLLIRWLKAAGTQKCRAVCQEGSVGAATAGNEMLWKAIRGPSRSGGGRSQKGGKGTDVTLLLCTTHEKLQDAFREAGGVEQTSCSIMCKYLNFKCYRSLKKATQI